MDGLEFEFDFERERMQELAFIAAEHDAAEEQMVREMNETLSQNV